MQQLDASLLIDPTFGRLTATCIPGRPEEPQRMIAGLNAVLTRYGEKHSCPVANDEPLTVSGTSFIVLASRALTSFERAWLEAQPLKALLGDGGAFTDIQVPLAVNLAKPVQPGWMRVCRVPFDVLAERAGQSGHPQRQIDGAVRAINVVQPYADPRITYSYEGAPNRDAYVAYRSLRRDELMLLVEHGLRVPSCKWFKRVEGFGDDLFDIPDRPLAP